MSITSRFRHTLVIRRNAQGTVGGALTVGGADTLLFADTAPGATTMRVDDGTGIAIGDWLRVGDTGETEFRQVTLTDLHIGPPAWTLVTLASPLGIAHDSGDEVREVDDAGGVNVDDWGMPVTTPTTIATVLGLIQPRTTREVEQSDQSGVVRGEHRGYMIPIVGLDTTAWVEVDGVRYDITGVRNAGGLDHHLELDLKQVT